MTTTTTTAAPAPAHPAATIVLLRDREGALEVLLARRQARLSFHGGAWVFPGGRVEPADYAGTPDDVVAAARRAAVREAVEEVGLGAAGALIALAHWTTPADAPKRFATWFFVARAADGAVRVDGGEIGAHRWLRPDAALTAQRAGELELPPATFVTLLDLREFAAVDEALAALAARPALTFLPRTLTLADGTCSLYQEDAGYADGELTRPGPRHRLWMRAGNWQYERTL